MRARFFVVSMIVAVASCSSEREPTPGEPGAGAPPVAGTPTPPGGGGLPATPPAGSSVKTTRETMTFNGATRKYILSVPVDYDAARTYPLVMEFHGNPGTADFMLDALPFDGASKGDAIVVYPNALGSDWDLYNPTDQNADMGYVKAVIDELASKYTIDTQRVLGFGWSGGGFFVNQLACRFPGLFKAIASHAGGAPDEPSLPNVEKHPNGYVKCAGGPIATFVVHGDKDDVVAPGSGEFTAMYWAYVNGCGDARSDTTPTPCRKYDGCPASAPVHLCMIPGLGHPLWSEGQAASWGFFRGLP